MVLQTWQYSNVNSLVTDLVDGVIEVSGTDTGSDGVDTDDGVADLDSGLGSSRWSISDFVEVANSATFPAIYRDIMMLGSSYFRDH